MIFIILNNWSFNTDENLESDDDFQFDLLSLKYSWRYKFLYIIIFNFEVRISW